jgi:HPt (histidine-containing phosphotransfer) domain-containing protein
MYFNRSRNPELYPEKTTMNPLTLDSQMLLNLYGGSHDDARFILNDYLEKHEEIMRSFNDAFRTGTESLSQCAHRHSSSFSYIGVPQLTTECKNFEIECKKAKDTSSVKSSFDRLMRILDESVGLVQKEIARLDKA